MNQSDLMREDARRHMAAVRARGPQHHDIPTVVDSPLPAVSPFWPMLGRSALRVALYVGIFVALLALLAVAWDALS